ncbi:tetratricopeptide repeat protein, partial [Streptomyces carpinensis]
MSRLSREKKREQKRAARSAASVTAPIAVHVPLASVGPLDGAESVDGTGTGSWASVGDVRVRSAPGEEIQQAVLDHLHGIALATGRSVLAMVTDERIGYVVPLQVHGDGSSTFAAEPLRTAAQDEPGRDKATHVLRQVPEPAAPRGTAPTFPLRAVPESRPTDGPSSRPSSPASPPSSSESAPTFALRAVPEPPAGTTPAAPPA